jgi:hypothetical protein
MGRAEARRLLNHSEFGKYTEEDDEDYEDVFGKANSTGECLRWADAPVEYTPFGQVMGAFLEGRCCGNWLISF